MKKIVLMPTRNDDWILDKSLACLSLWADAIFIADQHSTDKTLAICSRFPCVQVISNPSKFHSTKVRQLLLDEARKISGNNFIMSVDSDEFVTADILEPHFWETVSACAPGTSFELQWVQLWRSAGQYRNDDSVWSNSWKQFAFIDDRVSGYLYTYGLNDHNPRVPGAMLAHTHRLVMPKILHYQFVNWDRMLSKQRFYRVQDYLQKKDNFFSALSVNNMYSVSKHEKNLVVTPTPPEWTEPYRRLGINIAGITDEPPYWYDAVVLDWFRQYGPGRFTRLDIWDVDWEGLRQLSLRQGNNSVPRQVIKDPRTIGEKVLQHNLSAVLSAAKAIKKIISFS